MNVTPIEMHAFAAECMRWSDETESASHRSVIIDIAKSWVAIATALERRTHHHNDVLPDLRRKLN